MFEFRQKFGRKFRRRGAFLLAFLLLGLAAAAPAGAASSRWIRAEIMPGIIAEARLVAAVDTAGELTAIPAGLDIRLPEGWKTYWRTPGEGGLPPRLDWSDSANVAGAELSYPAPTRYEWFDLFTFGYAERVLFPLSIAPRRAGDAVFARLGADLLICSDLCVPARFDLSLDLPAGPSAPDGEAANLIDRARALVPDDGAASGLEIVGAAAEGEDVLTLRVAAGVGVTDFDVFVEAPDFWSFGPPRIQPLANGRVAVASLPVTQRPPEPPPLAAIDMAATVVVRDGGPVRAATLPVVLTGSALPLSGTALPPAEGAAVPPALALILLTAVLGGLILNLMPCVLPVLSLKILSVLKHGGGRSGTVRLNFLAAAAGIISAFLALAAAAIALRAGGGAIGWGIQFQQPLFLIFMIVVLTLFGCNLLGLFEISLPAGLATRLGVVGDDHSPVGNFLTGAFATLLATPCSAPFLGTSVSFALSRGPVEILAVFAALGLGLALPYLLIAGFPALATRLPRPGLWMVRVRQGLSLALFATALWLVTVLAAQITLIGAAVVAALMVGVGLAVWLPAGGVLRKLGAGVAVALALAAFFVPERFAGADRQATQTAPSGWLAFDPTRVSELVSGGQTVFVDVTADWCITCQANKALVLDRDPVSTRLTAAGLSRMRADWTRPDEAISHFLADFGRFGIPFDIVFGPAAPWGIVLPELLSTEAVLSALDRASGLDSAPSGG